MHLMTCIITEGHYTQSVRYIYLYTRAGYVGVHDKYNFQSQVNI